MSKRFAQRLCAGNGGGASLRGAFKVRSLPSGERNETRRAPDCARSVRFSMPRSRCSGLLKVLATCPTYTWVDCARLTMTLTLILSLKEAVDFLDLGARASKKVEHWRARLCGKQRKSTASERARDLEMDRDREKRGIGNGHGDRLKKFIDGRP